MNTGQFGATSLITKGTNTLTYYCCFCLCGASADKAARASTPLIVLL